MINYNILKSFYKLIRKQGIKKAIEALEKQIPQLPYNHRKTTDGTVIAQCSICDQEIFFPESYCVCCGHAIDWTDWKTKSEKNIIIDDKFYYKHSSYPNAEKF